MWRSESRPAAAPFPKEDFGKACPGPEMGSCQTIDLQGSAALIGPRNGSQMTAICIIQCGPVAGGYMGACATDVRNIRAPNEPRYRSVGSTGRSLTTIFSRYGDSNASGSAGL